MILCLKRLKFSREGKSSGNVFQRPWAETANALLDPQIFRLKLTGLRRIVEDDLSVLDRKKDTKDLDGIGIHVTSTERV